MGVSLSKGKYQGDLRAGKRHGWGICAFPDRYAPRQMQVSA